MEKFIDDIKCPYCGRTITGTDELEFDCDGQGFYSPDVVCLDCKGGGFALGTTLSILLQKNIFGK